MDESRALDLIASNSTYAQGPNAQMIHYTAKIFSRYLKNGKILELGPAEGLLTKELCKWATSLTLVDGSSLFCRNLEHTYPNAIVINALFEELRLEGKFDFIVLGHVLEHVEDPVFVLKIIQNMLEKTGKILCAVPNSRSIHRQAAVVMGLLPSEDSMSPADMHHGHRRVYNPELFRQHFLAAGYTIDVFGGYWLKPLSDRQLERDWSAHMMDAFFQLGERYPDIAAELYIVASVRPVI